MPEDRREPPTYHANVVTMNLTVDEMTMEFRSYLPAHRELFRAAEGQELTALPPPTAEEVYSIEPIARVVLTFAAVRALKQYLDQALPITERTRKSQ